MNKRAEISCPVVLRFTRNVDTRKGFIDSHTQIRVAFIVFQFYIVTGLMCFNQVIL